MERRNRGFSRAVVIGFGAVVVLSYLSAAVRLAAHHSFFNGDDLVGFWMATHKPFATYLAMPLDIHFAPLHRLVTYLLRTLAPMNFEAGLLVLAAFHLAGVVLLYLTLARLCPSPYNWAFVCLYATHVYLPVLFMWWTSGLHRLPCLAFSIGAVYAYVRFRERGRWGWAAATFAGEILAFGFFMKAVLVPFVLVGIEWCLRRETPVSDRRRNAAVLGIAGAIGVACPALWHTWVSKPARALALDVHFQLACQKSSWTVLLESTLGFLHGHRVPIAVAGVAWLGVIGVTVWKDRASLRAWCCLVSVVSVSILVTCLPFSRFVIFGGNAVDRIHRYYFELMFPVVLFSAIAFRGVMKGAETWRAARPAFVQALVAALIVCAEVHSFVNAAWLVSEPAYADFANQRNFVGRLLHGFYTLRARGTDPVLVDGDLPLYVLGWVRPYRLKSTLFQAMGIEAKFGPAFLGAYEIGLDGALRPVTPPRQRRH